MQCMCVTEASGKYRNCGVAVTFKNWVGLYVSHYLIFFALNLKCKINVGTVHSCFRVLFAGYVIYFCLQKWFPINYVIISVAMVGSLGNEIEEPDASHLVVVRLKGLGGSNGKVAQWRLIKIQRLRDNDKITFAVWRGCWDWGKGENCPNAQKNPRAHKNKIGTPAPPPKKPKIPPPL